MSTAIPRVTRHIPLRRCIPRRFLSSLGKVSQQGEPSFLPKPKTTATNFLSQVDATARNVLQKYPPETRISDLVSENREALVVARRLQLILADFDRCSRCWLKPSLCICSQCPPLEDGLRRPLQPTIHRLFLLVHHKEIGLAVDSAKMILAAFPLTCRLVVSDIGPEFQPTMQELNEAVMGKKCLVLFPTANARTFDDLQPREHRVEMKGNRLGNTADTPVDEDSQRWDVVVVDGTWSQARKLHERYIPSEDVGGPQRILLGRDEIERLSTIQPDGHQLRKHPIKWRQIGTLEATRLLLRDMMIKSDGSPVDSRNDLDYLSLSDTIENNNLPCWEMLARYQQIANDAARQQLGR